MPYPIACNKHIHAANKLLKMEFPEVAGIQSSLLSQKTSAFKRRGEGSIQIHHDRQSGHWVMSTMCEGNIILYDSKYTPNLSKDMEKQLRAIYGGSQYVIVPHITQQRGSKDCGLFAIAYAWHLAQGEKPQQVVFQQKAMRDRFISCLTSIKFHPFPHVQKKATRLESDYHKL